jgi:hypothetical protein
MGRLRAMIERIGRRRSAIHCGGFLAASSMMPDIEGIGSTLPCLGSACPWGDRRRASIALRPVGTPDLEDRFGNGGAPRSRVPIATLLEM